MPGLSVIMPCKDAERFLGFQLDALAAQATTFDWELIVVDNGSTDGSAGIADSFAGRIAVRLVPAPEQANSAYARNVGTREARADKLVFVDADDEVAPGYLEAMYSALRDHDAVTTEIDCESLNPPWTLHAHAVPEAVPPLIRSGSFGVTKRVLEAVGGWPEDYVEAHDLALSLRLRLAGVEPFVITDPLLRHRLRDSMRGLYRQTRAWGFYQVLAHREFGTRTLPRRPKAVVRAEWSALGRGLLEARSRADLARCAVRCGYLVGRVEGSIRFKALYL